MKGHARLSNICLFFHSGHNSLATKTASAKTSIQVTIFPYKFTKEQSSMAYSYTPLSSSYIRLLVLEPYTNDSRRDSLIRSRLISVKSSTLEYQALSYCWGDDGKKKDILIRDKVMQVGENLWSALDHLRRSSFGIGGKGFNHWSTRLL